MSHPTNDHISDQYSGLYDENAALKEGIWKAYDVLMNDKYVSRAYNARMILEALLDDYGYPDIEEG
jgi:hypothetical protein